jgi:beta-phosphoglucomutase
MSSIRGCIFDLDGVVVDTAKYHFLAWRRLAGELGFEFTEEHNERLKGVSRMKSLDILLEAGGISLDEETRIQLAEKKNNWYVEYISKMDSTEVLPGVLEFIRKLKGEGILIALGSVSKNAGIVLQSTGISGYFDTVVDGNKVTKAKPDPAVFLKAAEGLNLKPQSCVVFEDAAAGIEAAINAGMHSIGVGSKTILCRADKVIPGFQNLPGDILDF